jgi:hypothetical protein
MQQAYAQRCGANRQTQIRQIEQRFPLLGINPCHYLFHDPVPSLTAAAALAPAPVSCEHLPEIQKPVEREPGFTDFPSGQPSLQERLKIGQRAVELLRDTHHRAGLLDTFDRFFQNVDLNHSFSNPVLELGSTARWESSRNLRK